MDTVDYKKNFGGGADGNDDHLRTLRASPSPGSGLWPLRP